MTKDSLLYVDHIIEAIGLIEEFVHGMKGVELYNDTKTYYAVLRLLQTMAESTQKLPAEWKALYAHIEWRDIAGFRNILVHDYLEGFDENLIWSAIASDLPILKNAMLDLRERMD
jgi:uncharacterized protein with HEPN domain